MFVLSIYLVYYFLQIIVCSRKTSVINVHIIVIYYILTDSIVYYDFVSIFVYFLQG